MIARADDEISGASSPSLEEATRVEGRAPTFTAKLSSAYRLSLGPFGAYLVTIALRAAAETASKPRLASLDCHFHSVAATDEVRLEATTLHSSRHAESVQVRMGQGDVPILTALACFVSPREGLDRDPPRSPTAPPPSLLQPLESIHSRFGVWFAEARPLYEPLLTQAWPSGDPPWGLSALAGLVAPAAPAIRTWIRLRPAATFVEPSVDAGRSIVAMDWLIPLVAAAGHMGERVVQHSTLDLHVAVHGSAPKSEWLYCEAQTGSATQGLAHGSASVWSQDGVLLATGSMQMVQRIRL